MYCLDMEEPLSIGRRIAILEVSGRITSYLLMACLSLVLSMVPAACASTAKSSSIPADLKAFLPASAVVASSFDRQTTQGRNASVTVTVVEAADTYVSAFKANAKQLGYIEQIDQTSAGLRVIAYRGDGDKAITMNLTDKTAVLVLLSPPN